MQNESAPKHTPTNWKVVSTTIVDNQNVSFIKFNEQGDCFDLLTAPVISKEDHLQLVNKGVHAVNLHDDLVKAVGKVITKSRHYEDTQEHLVCLTEKEFEDMRALLHRAKEGQ